MHFFNVVRKYSQGENKKDETSPSDKDAIKYNKTQPKTDYKSKRLSNVEKKQK